MFGLGYVKSCCCLCRRTHFATARSVLPFRGRRHCNFLLYQVGRGGERGCEFAARRSWDLRVLRSRVVVRRPVVGMN
jgi:hypothetical protein